MSKIDESPWISQRAARTRLGVGNRRLGRLMADDYVGVRELRGLPPLLSRADVDRLASASTRPARMEAAAAPAV